MKDYRIGDTIKTLDGDFKIINIIGIMNPLTSRMEKSIMVDFNGERKVITNDRIIE